MSIRLVTASLVLVAALTGCAGTTSSPDTGVRTSTEATAAISDDAGIYSAVIRQLVMVDHTFGQSPSPFKYVYVINGVTPQSAQLHFESSGTAFSEKLRSEISQQTSDLPPLEFITKLEDKGNIQRQGVTAVENDGVIIGLGPIQPQPDGSVHVGAGLWCGGDCAGGLTYVLRKIDGKWQLTGNLGDHSIS